MSLPHALSPEASGREIVLLRVARAILASAIAAPLLLAVAFSVGLVVVGWMDPQGMDDLVRLTRETR